MLKLQPYAQSSVVNRRFPKLSYKISFGHILGTRWFYSGGRCKRCTTLAGELVSNGTLRCGVGRMGRECQVGL
jgi:hypothetical protein